MHDGDIDPDARGPHPGGHLPPPLLEARREVLHQAIGGPRGRRARRADAQRAPLRVAQERLQVADSPRARPGEIDLIGPQGREHQDLLTCAGDRHIQPSLSAVLVQRPEVHGHVAALVRTVAHGEHDHVPLVALDVLQVLHEHRLLGALIKEALQLRMLADRAIEQVHDQGLLRLTERHDADGA